MTSASSYLRRLELLVGPLAETEGGGPPDQGILLRSDGSRNDIAMSFSVERTLQGAPNTGTIEVSNLSPGTRNAIRASVTRVRLTGGYTSTSLDVIAQGALKTVATAKSGSDIVTTLEVLDGYGPAISGVTARTFTGGSTVASVVRELASDLPGVEVGPVEIAGTLGAGGLSVSGRATQEIDRLGDAFGFTWSVQDGVFQAVADDASFARAYRVSGDAGNLIYAAPDIAGPQQQTDGVVIDAILDPRVRPGEIVDLVSTISPDLSGQYKVNAITASGGTYTDDWTMQIKGYRL